MAFTKAPAPPDTVPGKFIVYGRSNCPYCDKALSALATRSVDYRSTTNDEHYKFLRDGEFRTVPQIWHGSRYVGGYEDLVKYLADA